MRKIARLIFALALLGVGTVGRALADPPAGSGLFDFGKPDSQVAKVPEQAPPTTPPPVAPAATTPDNTSATTPVKLPVPTKAALADASEQVNEAFSDDITAAKTRTQKLDLSAKMLQAAIEEKSDMAGKYVLFHWASDLSVNCGDFAGACKAIDEMANAFQVNVWRMKGDAATAVSKSPLADAKAFVSDTEAQSDEAQKVDEYEAAKQMDDLALTSARHSGDKQLIADVTTHSQMVAETLTAYAPVKQAEAVIKTRPDDPDANLAVGRFRCFVKGDWEGGMPMLAKGSEETLKALANKELAGATDVEAQMALGDGWWGASEKEKGSRKSQVQNRAGKWYSQAAPSLTGLLKAKVEKRLRFIGNTENSPTSPKTVDLLKLVDVERDSIAGRWELRNGTLISDGFEKSKIEFLYRPPPQYDYRVVFVRKSGSDTICLACWCLGHQFQLNVAGWANKISGFGEVNGLDADRNPTGRRSLQWVENGRKYLVVVKVRKDGVEAYLDGKLLTEWKTGYSDLSANNWWPWRRNDTIGLGSCSSPTVFYSAEVIEITGSGQQLK